MSPAKHKAAAAASVCLKSGPGLIFLNWRSSGRKVVEGTGFEPVYAMRADLQSAAFNHSATPPRDLSCGPQLTSPDHRAKCVGDHVPAHRSALYRDEAYSTQP